MYRGLRLWAKEEIRVIALKPITGRELLGVIYRGKYWFDGILRVRLRRLRGAYAVAEAIKMSKYYDELRAVMLDHELSWIDIHLVNDIIGLPVLKMDVQGHIEECVGVRYEDAQRIVKRLTFQDVPEPLRVARVLALSLRLMGMRIT